jgi:hypothetical protein
VQGGVVVILSLMAVIHLSITVIRLFDSMPGFPLWANDGLAAVVAAAGLGYLG